MFFQGYLIFNGSHGALIEYGLDVGTSVFFSPFSGAPVFAEPLIEWVFNNIILRVRNMSVWQI